MKAFGNDAGFGGNEDEADASSWRNEAEHLKSLGSLAYMIEEEIWKEAQADWRRVERTLNDRYTRDGEP